ncbi:hypothetical protein ACSVH5_11740 [Flavobacterium sp. RSSA_27]|uniref:hypothetical protein n=1 Tax=Flavobacterium sp. RSSA_27 TaxID=3447667 RepID=UPI003F30E8CA
MKRIVVFSFYLLAIMTFVSCTNDELEPITHSSNTSIFSDDSDYTGGNSSGQTPITPPKK